MNLKVNVTVDQSYRLDLPQYGVKQINKEIWLAERPSSGVKAEHYENLNLNLIFIMADMSAQLVKT